MSLDAELERLDEELEATPGDPGVWDLALTAWRRAGKLERGLEAVWAAWARHQGAEARVGRDPDAGLRRELLQLTWRTGWRPRDPRLGARSALEDFLALLPPGSGLPGPPPPGELAEGWHPLAVGDHGDLLVTRGDGDGQEARITTPGGTTRARIAGEGELAWGYLGDGILLTIGRDRRMHLYNFGALQGVLRPMRHYDLPQWGRLDEVDHARTVMNGLYLLLVARHGEGEDLWFFWMGTDDPPTPRTMRLPPGGLPLAAWITATEDRTTVHEVAWSLPDGGLERRRYRDEGGYGQRDPDVQVEPTGAAVSGLAYEAATGALWVARGPALVRIPPSEDHPPR